MKSLIELIKEEKEKQSHKDEPILNKSNIDLAIGWFESEVETGEKKYTSSDILKILEVLKW